MIKEGDTIFCTDPFQIISVLDRERPDIINVGPMSIRGKLWPFLIKIKKKAKITTIYWMNPVFSDNIAIKFRSLLFHLNVFDAIYGCSPRIVLSLKQKFLRAHLLLPPVPEEYFLHKTGNGLSDKIRTIGYIGRIGGDKGVDWFLKQDMQVLDRFGYRIKIYGYWDENDKDSKRLHRLLSEKFKSQYIPSIISFVNYRKDNIALLMESLDLLILPYKTLKGTVDLPLVVLEACAKGCRVATTDVGDIYRVLKTNVIQMDTNDKIIQVIERAKRYSKPRLESNFKSRAVAGKYLETIIRR